MRTPTLLPILALAASCNYPEFGFVADARVEDSAVMIDTPTDDTAVDTRAAVDTALVETAASDTRPEADTKPPSRAWLFDFGSSAATTPGYNNVDQSKAAGGMLDKLIDSTGAPTTLSLRISSIDSFHTNGDNTAGTTMPASSVPFAASATSDSLYGATMTWMGEVSPKAVIELTGLNPSRVYDLEIFASRMAGTGVLESEYTVRGAGSPVTLYLDANDNTANLARFTLVAPTATGSLTLTTTAGPKNTSPYGFYYVGAMRLTER